MTTRWTSSMLDSLVGQSVHAIDTPTLVIDLEAMERNLARMQTYAQAQGVLLRPHAKMHKCAALAQLQMREGAAGVCVQKVSEAQVLAELGVSNITLTNELISLQKCELLAQLIRRLEAKNASNSAPQLTLTVDSLLGIERIAQAMHSHASGARLKVLVEIDVGQGRCGVPPGPAALELVRAIAQQPQLSFAGLQAYHGRVQHVRAAAERRAIMAQVLRDVEHTSAIIKAAGFDVPLVTGAGTGSFVHEATSGVYGELQAGSYLFMDADYAANEPDVDADAPHFEHALFVKSQVMSRASTHAVCDAGHKSHAIDSGLPRFWAGHAADWIFANGGDEHGIIRGSLLPSLGGTVWLIPGHCDPTVNLHDWMVGVRGGLINGQVTELLRVDTRGCLF